MPQIYVLSHKVLALVTSTRRLVTIMEVLIFKMHCTFKLVRVEKQSRKV